MMRDATSLLGLLCAAALCWATPAVAGLGPDASLRPMARGVEAPSPDNALADPRLSTSHALSPRARPLALQTALAVRVQSERAWRAPIARQGAAAAPTSDDLATNTSGVVEVSANVRSLRPILRPPTIVERAMARQRAERAGRAGGIQGVQGDEVGAVAGRGACGIDEALRVRVVSGVRLSTPALLDIPTTRALQDWIDEGLKPAIGGMGGGVASVRVVAHYACRTRNNQPGARLSEHSFGRAIDIAGFTLRNGEEIVLLRDWGRGRKGRALREMHAAACVIFGTVLGPEANRFHRDHFHFDTARYRSGSYCR